MNIENETKPIFGLKWTWHIFLASNILLVIGIAVTWIIVQKTDISPGYLMLPMTICNLISIFGVCLFYFFDSKDIWLLKSHVNKRWLHTYMSSGFIFLLAVIFNFIFLWFRPTEKDQTNFFTIDIIVTSILSVISIGLYRFGRYKIDLAIYRRKRGIDNQKPIPPSTPHESIGVDEKASSHLKNSATKE